MAWRPSASLEALRLRADLLRRTRRFFDERGVLEVETPLLDDHSVTEPQIESLRAEGGYLQTSPEYAMKRLLAAGSGAIYQITRAFRAGEAGARHNPEFTILEWYRPGFTLADLVAEVGELLRELLGCEGVETKTYRDLFLEHAGVDPFGDLAALRAAAGRAGDVPDLGDDRDAWLDLLLTHFESSLGRDRPLAIVDYPASQAALARRHTDSGGRDVSERFEVFFRGLELANGYHELADASEQRSRFERDRARRRERAQADVAVDERLLAALEAGLPDCSGVAIGFDRIAMLAAGASSIGEAAFTRNR